MPTHHHPSPVSHQQSHCITHLHSTTPIWSHLYRHPNLRVAYVAQHAFAHIEDHLEMTPVEYIMWRYRGTINDIGIDGWWMSVDLDCLFIHHHDDDDIDYHHLCYHILSSSSIPSSISYVLNQQSHSITHIHSTTPNIIITISISIITM